jgi:nicotinate-nucleotide adenylyltransferase
MAKRKIALFGGTFDPVHLGHTTVAAEAIKQIGADKIIFIPAKCSPLKGLFPKASVTDRFAMLALAIADDKNLEMSDYELRKAEPSYTIQTVRQFQTGFGSDTLIYWLIGADSVDELPLWYEITKLIDECNLSTMYRAGCNPPDFSKFKDIWGPERVEKLQHNVIQTPLIDMSSTEIRTRLAAGQDVTDMLHPNVADYIRKYNLYQPKEKR